MIVIDGSAGEGGGQILRTSLAHYMRAAALGEQQHLIGAVDRLLQIVERAEAHRLDRAQQGIDRDVAAARTGEVGFAVRTGRAEGALYGEGMKSVLRARANSEGGRKARNEILIVSFF